jgi:hypothetical protein
MIIGAVIAGFVIASLLLETIISSPQRDDEPDTRSEIVQ